MASMELLKMINQAISNELQVSIQYMWQHVCWSGVKSFAVNSELKNIAIMEMKHAEIIAERLFYLGEKPTVNPSKVIVGETLKEMFEQNIKDEEKTISLYKQIIQKAKDEGDLSTAHIFNRILLEEEEHHDFFISIVEDL